MIFLFLDFFAGELPIPTCSCTLIYNTLYAFSAFYPLALTKRILNSAQRKGYCKCSPFGLSSRAKRLCQEDFTYLLHWCSLCGFREGLLALQAIVQILCCFAGTSCKLWDRANSCFVFYFSMHVVKRCLKQQSFEWHIRTRVSEHQKQGVGSRRRKLWSNLCLSHTGNSVDQIMRNQ